MTFWIDPAPCPCLFPGMGQLSPQKLVSDISGGKFHGLYFFFGTEDYRIGEAVKYVANQFLPKMQLATNFRRLDGRKTKCPDLIAELSVFPMLGERQVFAVSDFQSYKPTEVDRVLKLLDPADPNRVVLLTSPSQRAPKKKSAFLKKINAVAVSVEFNRLTQSQTAGTITARLGKADLTIEPEALRLLVGLLDGNRGGLESEVGKLIDYKQPGETVDAADIEKIASGYQTFTVFELADHIVAGDRRRVLGLIRRFLTEGSTPTGLLYFLGQHFISLYLVKAGKSLEPQRRWLESRFRSQAASFDLDRLSKSIALIAEVDSSLRHKRVVPELTLDRLVLEMMSP